MLAMKPAMPNMLICPIRLANESPDRHSIQYGRDDRSEHGQDDDNQHHAPELRRLAQGLALPVAEEAVPVLVQVRLTEAHRPGQRCA